jgi:hypothetical protein
MHGQRRIGIFIALKNPLSAIRMSAEGDDPGSGAGLSAS